MIRNGKKLTALVLAWCMLLGLAACGGKSDADDTNQLSSTVYVPQFIDLDLGVGSESYVRGSCTDGKNVYMLADIYPDYEAGETGDSRITIFRIPLDGSGPVELENFKADAPPEGYDTSNTYVQNMTSGADGTLWVTEQVYATKYDLPDNFDPETDSMWNYEALESVEENYMIQLDSTGTELTRINTTDLQEKAEVEYIYSGSVKVDKEGNLFVGSDGKIVVMDADLNVLFTLESSDLWGGDMVMLSDGSMAVQTTTSDPVNNTYTRQLKTIDKSAKDWGKTYPLPQNAYEVYTGGGGYLFYYKSGDALYGYKAPEEGAEAGEAADSDQGERLLSWLESDINADEVAFFSFLPDGRLVVMTESYGPDGRENSLAVLTATARSELPEKTVLTYGTMYLGSEERTRILEFNKNNPQYRIEVRDYSEFNTESDYNAGLNKLNTEIIAGQMPDIVSISSLPIRQYGAKGLLEDLWPYIEADAEIGGREGLMERVFQAAEQDGKLYQVFSTFGIRTVIGSQKVVGDRMTWTLADLQEALAAMPEGCAIFGEGDTKADMLRSVMSLNLDNYLDWENGSCNFDSDQFKAVLEFCNSFPAEFDWENYEYDDSNSEPTRIANGRQMLMEYTLNGFEGLQLYEAIFGGAEALSTFYLKYDYSQDGGTTVTVTDTPVMNEWGPSDPECRLIPGRYISYIGYPMEDGSCGSCFTVNDGLAISSTCKDKDAAWSFVRELLLPGEEGEDGMDRWSWNHYGFPTNKVQFDRIVEEAMTVKYMEDYAGNPVLGLDGEPLQETNGGYGYGDVMVMIQATTQEEYDQFMELYNAVDTIYSYDTSVYDIVSDVAGSYFAGDRSLDDAAALIQNRVSNYVNESL